MMAAKSRFEPIESEAAHRLTDHLQDAAPVTPEMAKQTGKDAQSLANARLRALRARQGSLADIPVTSDDFARMKREEIEQEERVIARRS